MAARHKSGLSAVVLPHFDIKHHMTFDLLVPGWYLRDVLFPDLESQSNIFCLLAIASHHRLLPFWWSNSFASCTDFGIRTPDL